MAIFKQDDFSAGMDNQYDPAKTADGAYPLLINGRVRRNVVSPVLSNKQLDAPLGFKQGLYAAGNLLILFNDGLAYYADVTKSPVSFFPLSNFTLMDQTAKRVYAEIVP